MRREGLLDKCQLGPWFPLRGNSELFQTKKGLLDTMEEGHCEKRSRVSNKDTNMKAIICRKDFFKIPRSAGQGLLLELAKVEETTDFPLGFCHKYDRSVILAQSLYMRWLVWIPKLLPSDASMEDTTHSFSSFQWSFRK